MTKFLENCLGYQYQRRGWTLILQEIHLMQHDIGVNHEQLLVRCLGDESLQLVGGDSHSVQVPTAHVFSKMALLHRPDYLTSTTPPEEGLPTQIEKHAQVVSKV